MKLKMKLLDVAVISLLALSASPANALPVAAASDDQGEGQPSARCNESACTNDDGLLFRVHTRGDAHPVPSSDQGDSLTDNRRVDVLASRSAPGRAKVAGTFSVDLPNGGTVWVTEDPTLGTARLNVQAPASVPFVDGRIAQPVQFQGYSNYAAFMERLEVVVYRATDEDRVDALATVAMPVANTSTTSWDGQLAGALNLRAGDSLIYVARAYGRDGQFDETVPQRIQLQTPEDHARNLQSVREREERRTGASVNTELAQHNAVRDAVYGTNALRVQNIAVHGSRVRIHGQDIPHGATVRIDGASYPVDLDRKFVAEFLQPIGHHRFELSVAAPDQAAFTRALDVEVSGAHRFLVAMADLTLSKAGTGDGEASLQQGGRDRDDLIADGRLAFYLKQKLRGKYLITAQADTQERDVRDLFNGFLDADAQDVFRRLDPDLYYPTYGDDSTTMRDVDTQGRFYLRADWDQNQALWGNFATGLSGTEYGQYNRSLYGAALSWRSRAATALGDAQSTLKLFGSQAQSAQGHNEFVGTGGSLYYLRQIDILPGSDRVTVEVRDPATGRTLSSSLLQRGADYEIDEMQGRIILSRPLAQITRDAVVSITRDAPLDGYEQFLKVDYEYIPSGFDADEATLGARGKHWFGDHLAVGGTYVDEAQAGDNYTLAGVDVTLQAGRGTYLKLEQSRTESLSSPSFYSTNGGFSFAERRSLDAGRSGEARAIEARANFRELGWTQRELSVGGWWRDVDAGFSTTRADLGVQIREYGAEFLGYVTQNLSVYGQYSHAERGGEVLEQQQLTADWRPDDANQWTAELRRSAEQRYGGTTDAMLAAVGYTRKVNSLLEIYGVAQHTVDDDSGRYADNDLYTVGSRYRFGDRSTIDAQYSDGSRGDAAQINAEYWMGADHSIYAGYRHSTDVTGYDSSFTNTNGSGWTAGQRWRLSNQVNVYNESQYLKDMASDAAGLAHTFGLDFYPGEGWRAGFTLQQGELDSASGLVTREAYSVNGGRTNEVTDWSSKLEYRRDSGAEAREQWVSTNRLFHRINDDWRVALRANYAKTTDKLNASDGARLAEVNAGFAYRAHDNTRWAAFGKYTYLYDLASPGQDLGASNDQRSQVLSLEAVYRLNPSWEVAGKLASRQGDYRLGRGQGAWLDSRADFAAAQLRYHLIGTWDGLAEYRVLDVRDGGRKHGWLVGVDRQIGRNFKLGAGYNFTDFSDDLTHHRYDNKGWFLNMTGYY